MKEVEDSELFERVKQGNLAAYEQIFKQHYGPLARYATSIIRDITMGEEIAQEVLMYIWEKRSQINLSSSLKAYLFSSVKNKCINYIKHELPRLQSTTDLSQVRGIENSPMTTDDAELMKKKIQHAIDQLPEKCKNIFVLSRYGGLTYAEIAEELEISVKTVENQMSIALKKLKESLSEELKEYRLK
ncbi:RNA polymerase sigma-70 factor [Marinoscillum sp.]|uniref:RNA polymerase sigma-70 factor n=1 Tax=Marinoscillum sp. TaxID=2024838 RepID=UPI003BAB4C69